MIKRKNSLLLGCFIVALSAGCATTQPIEPSDPWEGWNRKVQNFNDGLDDYVMKPVAKGYQWVMPGFVDRAVSNVFSNIDDIGVTINDSLQGKFYQSGMDATRFIVNSTIGLGGLFDVSSMIDLPKHNEDFGQTLGFWGVSTGPYMVLPFFGSSSPRGIAGLVGDAAMNPVTYIGSPYISSGLFAINAIDVRADNLSTEKIANEAATFGRYEFFRDAYRAQRNSLVLDGNVPEEDDFIFNEDFDEDDSLAPISPY